MGFIFGRQKGQIHNQLFFFKARIEITTPGLKFIFYKIVSRATLVLSFLFLS